MKLRTRTVPQAALLAGAAFLMLTAAVGAQKRQEPPPQAQPLLAAANTFKNTFAPGEAVCLAVALANPRDESVFVPVAFPPTIELLDGKGNRVMGDPIREPPPPPPGWAIVRNGKRVAIVPVWELPAKSGRVMVIDDALKRYHKHIGKGVYTIRVRVGSGMYDPNSIIKREDAKYRLWVEASTRTPAPREVRANEIRIRIE